MVGFLLGIQALLEKEMRNRSIRQKVQGDNTFRRQLPSAPVQTTVEPKKCRAIPLDLPLHRGPKRYVAVYRYMYRNILDKNPKLFNTQLEFDNLNPTPTSAVPYWIWLMEMIKDRGYKLWSSSISAKRPSESCAVQLLIANGSCPCLNQAFTELP